MNEVAVTATHRNLDVERLTGEQGLSGPSAKSLELFVALVEHAGILAEDFVLVIAEQGAEARIAVLQQSVAHEDDPDRRMVEDRQQLGRRRLQVHRLLRLHR